jgi:hypothetical protein
MAIFGYNVTVSKGRRDPAFHVPTTRGRFVAMKRFLVRVASILVAFVILAGIGACTQLYLSRQERFLLRAAETARSVYALYPPGEAEKPAIAELGRLGTHYKTRVSDELYAQQSLYFVPPERYGTKYSEPSILISEDPGFFMTEQEAAYGLMHEMALAAQYAKGKECDEAEADKVAALFLEKAMKVPEFAKGIPRPER